MVSMVDSEELTNLRTRELFPTADSPFYQLCMYNDKGI